MESSAARQASSTTHPELRLVRDAAELLPDPLSRFIGRETERREVARILEGTRLLFYGSWNGRIIFDEPMITKAVLESRETVDVTLPPRAVCVGGPSRRRLSRVLQRGDGSAPRGAQPTRGALKLHEPAVGMSFRA